MARNTRRRYQKAIVACEDALTLSRDLNTAGLSSAITLANELRTDYMGHVADQGASVGEHKALHTAGQLVAAAAYNLATLLTLTNDLTTKYALHNTDAAGATPTYHIAQDTTHALTSSAAVTTLAGAITQLNDIKTKYNLHQAETTAHRTGNLYPTTSTNAALGVAVTVTVGMGDVKVGDNCSWSILNSGAGTVTGVSAVPGDGCVVFTFSADPQSAIISYIVTGEA